MLNRYVPPPEGKRAAELDAIAVMLAGFSGRTEGSLESRYAPFGTLVVTQFTTAPFPHPARAQGHKYHADFYSAAGTMIKTAVAHVHPERFSTRRIKVDLVVHFHGWRTRRGRNPWKNTGSSNNLPTSGKNAVLIVPQGPRLRS